VIEMVVGAIAIGGITIKRSEVIVRVALVVPGFSANAEDWCIPALRNFVATLALTDDVRVFALRYPPISQRYHVFGAEVFALGGGTTRRFGSADLYRRALTLLGQEHRRRAFDVIHAFWADESGLVASLAGKLLRRPSVVSLAGGELVGFADIGYGGQLARLQRLKVDVALRLAEAVTAGSSYQARLARRIVNHFRDGEPKLLPLGVDARQFAPLSERSRARSPTDDLPGCYRAIPTVLNVASLVPIKDHATLVRSAALAREGGRPYRLEIVGDGPCRDSLLRLAQMLRVSDDIRFRGSVPHNRLPEVYRGADLFALSSRHEAQCLAALEAGACGRVVVGTEVGVVPDLAPPAGAVRAGDPHGLAEAIIGALNKRGENEAEDHATRDRVVRYFALDRCTTGFRSLYQTLISGGSRRLRSATASGPAPDGDHGPDCR
jgi:glycosyltransferase involved in cell wall biosynthesis